MRIPTAGNPKAACPRRRGSARRHLRPAWSRPVPVSRVQTQFSRASRDSSLPKGGTPALRQLHQPPRALWHRAMSSRLRCTIADGTLIWSRVRPFRFLEGPILAIDRAGRSPADARRIGGGVRFPSAGKLARAERCFPPPMLADASYRMKKHRASDNLCQPRVRAAQRGAPLLLPRDAPPRGVIRAPLPSGHSHP